MLLRIVLGILPLFYQTEEAMEDLQLLTVDQVSRRLAVGPDAVRRWLRGGQMPGYRLPGGDWRIRPEDVDAVLTPTSGKLDNPDRM